MKVSHRNARITKFWSHHHMYNLNHVMKFFGDAMNKNYDVVTFISKYYYFKKA